MLSYQDDTDLISDTEKNIGNPSEGNKESREEKNVR